MKILIGTLETIEADADSNVPAGSRRVHTNGHICLGSPFHFYWEEHQKMWHTEPVTYCQLLTVVEDELMAFTFTTREATYKFSAEEINEPQSLDLQNLIKLLKLNPADDVPQAN